MNRVTLNLVLMTGLALMSFGCASTHSYFAPTAEERERGRAEEEAQKKKADEGVLGGPLGDILSVGAAIGSVFK